MQLTARVLACSLSDFCVTAIRVCDRRPNPTIPAQTPVTEPCCKARQKMGQGRASNDRQDNKSGREWPNNNSQSPSYSSSSLDNHTEKKPKSSSHPVSAFGSDVVHNYTVLQKKTNKQNVFSTSTAIHQPSQPPMHTMKKQLLHALSPVLLHGKRINQNQLHYTFTHPSHI